MTAFAPARPAAASWRAITAEPRPETSAGAASAAAADSAVAAAAAAATDLQAAAAAADESGSALESLALLQRSGLLGAAAALADPRSRLQLLQVLAHVGRGSLSVGRLYEGHVNALVLLASFGTPEQVARATAAALRGVLLAVWNTEAAPGVRLEGGGPAYTLHGSKVFASGAGIAGGAIVTARCVDGRAQMVLVDTENASLVIDRSFWQPLGMRPTASFEVDFTGTAVAAADLVGEPGDYLREPAFSGGAVRFAAVQQGGIEAVFDETRSFLRALTRGGDPYQRARLGEMAALVASGRHWVQAAALNAGDSGAAAAAQVAHANLMRTAIEANALRVLHLAERSVGARGLLKPAPFARLHRDLTHYLRQAGPDAAVAAAGAYVLDRDDPAHRLWSE